MAKRTKIKPEKGAEGIKRYKPTSAGIRFKVGSLRNFLFKGRPVKSLTKGRSLSGGRNVHGRLTARRKGGGVKNLYRKINLNYESLQDYEIIRREYDPNRSAFIDLTRDTREGKLNYILAETSTSPGDQILENVRSPGSRIQLNKLKEGDQGFALSFNKEGNSKIGRAAGTYVQLKNFTPVGKAVVKLPSGELRIFPPEAWMTFGRCSNLYHNKRNLSKAGTARRLNRRPITRGMAQGAYDHPMGSKSGKIKGHVPKTRWGKLAKGVKTRPPKKLSNKLILKRRK